MKQDKIYFNHRDVVNLFIVYELDTLSTDFNADFTRGDCLIGAVKLTKVSDPY